MAEAVALDPTNQISRDDKPKSAIVTSVTTVLPRRAWFENAADLTHDRFLTVKHRTLALTAFALVISAALAPAAPVFRLFEIFTERIINDVHGTPIFDRGRLNAQGEFTHDIYAQIAPGTTIPTGARNRDLLPFVMWPAYDALGTEALANFKFDSVVTIAGQSYFVVTVADRPKLDVGILRAISTRGGIAPGGEPLIGGFVIDDHPRRVLVRGVGPGLASVGVTTPLANPVITLFRQGESSGFASNDDWGQQTNVADIEEETAAAGLFPLNRTSKDAVLLIELPSGVYTAHLTSHDATGGTVLSEIYTLP